MNYNRRTLMLDEKIYTKIRLLQAKRIKRTKLGCSFSKMLNIVLKQGLEKHV